MMIRTLAVLSLLLFNTALGAEGKPPPPPSSTPGREFDPPVPPPPSPTEAPRDATATTPKPVPTTGWAKPGAFISFGLGLAVLSLSIADDLAGHFVDPDHQSPHEVARDLSIVHSALVLVGVPVMSFAGSSARFDHGIAGSKLMRVLGWLGYALSLTFELVNFIDRQSGEGIAPGIAEVGGGLGALSFVCFGLDALWSAQEADEVISIMAATEPATLEIAPRFALLRGPNGSSAPSVGVGGRF